jgi:hypothetical protein
MDFKFITLSSSLSCNLTIFLAKFEPFSQIKHDLAETKHNSTIDSIPFFAEAQKDFHETYDLLLHVAFVFYIMTAVWMGLGLLTGLAAFVVGVLGFAVPIFTSVSLFSLPSRIHEADGIIVCKYLSPHSLSPSYSCGIPGCCRSERH